MTVLPSPTEQVRYESAVRNKYAIFAFTAGLFIVGSLLAQEIGSHTSVNEATAELLNSNRRFPLDIVGAILDSIGLLFVAALLNWLYRITMARDPKVSPMPRYLSIIGAPIIGVVEIFVAVVFSIKAHDFAKTGNQGYPQAYHLLHPISTLLGVCSDILEPLGALLLAAGFIWTALNSMRVGLLPRPMGYAGILAGALVIFAIGPISLVIQGIWLVLAAVLISGRWPNGTPPAWEEGIAIPWLPGGVPNRDAAQDAKVKAGRGPARGAAAPAKAAKAAAPAEPEVAGDYTPRRKKKKR